MYSLYSFSVIILLVVWIYKIIWYFYLMYKKNEKTCIVHKLPIHELEDKIVSQNKKLVFILPVYKELELIQQTCLFYKEILERYSFIELIIVWTAKEKIDGENSTLNKAKLCPHSRIAIIESPNASGNMATQDNFATTYILKKYKDRENIWLHFLNIDSRINEDYFHEVFYHIVKNDSLMLQSSIFLWNYSKLPAFLQGWAVSQTRRTITWEQLRILENQNITDWRLYNVVWHWLIINANLYTDLHWFPENTFNEDLHFWFYLSLLGKKCYSLNSYEIADVPVTFKERFLQAEWRFIGAFEYTKYYSTFLRKFSKSITIKGIFMTLQGYSSALWRLLVSYMLLFILVYSVVHNQYIWYWLTSIGIYFLQYLLTIIFLNKKKYLSQNTLTTLLKCYIFISIWSLPATTWLIKYILHYLKIKSIKKYKTSHI